MQSQEYLEKLQREMKYRNYSPRTIEVYLTCVKYFLKYIKNDILKITKETIIDFTIHLQSKNKAPKTINLYKGSIEFFSKEILQLNLDFDIKLSKEPKKLPIILSKKEILRLIDNVNNLKHKLILSLSYSAWLRVSEVINLKIWDINLEELSIHIKCAKWQKDRISIFSKKLKNELWKIISFKNKKWLSYRKWKRLKTNN